MSKPNTMPRIVIIGASSAIAEHCARLWVQDSTVDLTLVGRDLAKLQRIEADLTVRSPCSRFQSMTLDCLDPIAIQALVDQLTSSSQAPLDTVLIAHGLLHEQTLCQTHLVLCRDVLMVNAVSPILFAEAFVHAMEKANHGTLAIIGSVAGDRMRRSNYTYGSAKRFLEAYTQGLRHRLSKTCIQITLIKPGPTQTPMTTSSKGMTLAKVEDVARLITQGMAKGKKIIYAPKQWALIMAVIRRIPDVIFRKMNV